MFEPLQVNFLHDDGLMLLFQQTHVVHDHHASGVSALQLHCYCNLEEEDDTETFFSLAFLQLVQENSLKKNK